MGTRAGHDAAGAAGPHPAVVRAVRRVLGPLVRVLLASGITYPFLTSLLKSVYVEVAENEFRLENKRQTDSRLSLLTGIHRKDVRRLRAEPREVNRAPATVSLGAQIVARWTGMPEFATHEGRPRPLPRLARRGEARSFEELVGSISKDIRPRAILDELLRLGVVRLDEDDRVCLEREAFVPVEGLEERAHYFGRNLHDHVAAAGHNLLGGAPPFVERAVYYGSLSVKSAEELRELSERRGMEALQEVNRRALVLQRRDARGSGGGRRINFGIYFFEDASTAASEETGDET